MREVYLAFWGKGKRGFVHITPVIDNIVLDVTFTKLWIYKIENIMQLKGYENRGMHVTHILKVKQKRIAFNFPFLYNCIGISKMITGERGVFLSPRRFYQAIKRRSEVIWEWQYQP